MTFDGARISEQGVNFAIAVVKRYVLNSSDREKIRAEFSQIWGYIPVILATQDNRGRFTYSGRPDIVKFLSRVDPSRIPWERYTLEKTR